MADRRMLEDPGSAVQKEAAPGLRRMTRHHDYSVRLRSVMFAESSAMRITTYKRCRSPGQGFRSKVACQTSGCRRGFPQHEDRSPGPDVRAVEAGAGTSSWNVGSRVLFVPACLIQQSRRIQVDEGYSSSRRIRTAEASRLCFAERGGKGDASPSNCRRSVRSKRAEGGESSRRDACYLVPSCMGIEF
jgi:hypothetical protein